MNMYSSRSALKAMSANIRVSFGVAPVAMTARLSTVPSPAIRVAATSLVPPVQKLVWTRTYSSWCGLWITRGHHWVSTSDTTRPGGPMDEPSHATGEQAISASMAAFAV